MANTLTQHSLATVAELHNSTSDMPLLDAPMHVEAHDAGDEVLYTATWPGLELGSRALFATLDQASPVPGSERPYEVVDNFRGVHEPANRRVIEVHRQIFGQNWNDMAHSRRLLWTVLEGRGQQFLGHDDSIHLYHAHSQRETVIGEEAAAASIHTAAMLAEIIYAKSEHGRRFMDSVDTASFQDIYERFTDAILGFDLNDGETRLGRISDLGNAWVNIHKNSYGLGNRALAALQSALENADPRQVSAMLDALYNTFVDDNGDTHYVSIHVRAEEPIPLQAMYHQRLPVEPYYDYFIGGKPRWFESYSGLDHTYFTAVAGTDGALPTGRDDGAHSVRPVLAWKTAAVGTRSHVRNFELPSHLRTQDREAEGMSYTDTTTGLVLAALANPAIREQWPKQSRLPSGLVESDSRFELVPGEREIPLGAAQTPLLALLSGDEIRETAMFDTLEHLAEQP